MITRIVKNIDLIISGSFVLIAILASIWAAITPQTWNAGMIVSLIGATSGFAIGFGMFVVKLFWGKPTYTTKQGTKVYIGSSSINQNLCEKALDFFVIHFAELYKYANEAQLKDMLTKTIIIFSKEPLESIGKGYYLTNCAGLQLGYTIGVCSLNGKITGTAIFHELAHEVDLVILGKDTDYSHSDTELWGVVGQIENLWSTTVGE